MQILYAQRMGESILSYGTVIVIIIIVASKDFLWNKLDVSVDLVGLSVVVLLHSILSTFTQLL